MEPLVWTFPEETVKPTIINLPPSPQKKSTIPFKVKEHGYITVEVIPSKISSNEKVQWLMADISRLYAPLLQRISVSKDGVSYTKKMGVWWEVIYTKDSIRFFLTIPNVDFLREGLKHSIRKCWSQSTVLEVPNPLPDFRPEITSLTKLELKHHSVLSLDTSNPQFSPLDSFLNTKHYLGEGDSAVFQMSLLPVGEEWNNQSREILDQVKKEKGAVPKKRSYRITPEEATKGLSWGVGVAVEEMLNMVGDIFVPWWVERHDIFNSRKSVVTDISPATSAKVRKEGFHTSIRIAIEAKDDEKRKSILRSLASGFDPLSGNNEFVEIPESHFNKEKEMSALKNRYFTKTSDVLGSLELSKIINVPDRKAQMEHQEELKIVAHRAQTPVPKEVFESGGIPFATYADTDGVEKTVGFPTKDVNLLCMTRIFIGEPNAGKTTAGVNFAIETFMRGYGAVYIDAADGAAIQKLLNLVPPHLTDKVSILDFTDRENPIGLGMSEAFSHTTGDVEELIAEEMTSYIELNSGTELSMTSRRWIELASKTVFRRESASLGDMLRSLRDREFCQGLLDSIPDKAIQREWNTWWEMESKQRDTLFNSAFYRIYRITNKRLLRNIFLQPPKVDDEGKSLVNFRKWMDEGCLVLIKVNETLREENVTAIVSFLLAKFNIAIISREDLTSHGKEPNPCFLILDEPDHYIKGSERWRNMLTRYRKYRCGLTFLFHGWEQLKEADRELPKMMRKAGPHYVIFNTDEANLESLRFVYEPEFEMREIVKGLPQFHALVRLKMYDREGGVTPAFMAKAINSPEKRMPTFENDNLYQVSAEMLGRPVGLVEEMIQDLDTPDIAPDEEEALTKRGVKQYEPEVQSSSRPRGFKNMGRGEFSKSDFEG